MTDCGGTTCASDQACRRPKQRQSLVSHHGRTSASPKSLTARTKTATPSSDIDLLSGSTPYSGSSNSTVTGASFELTGLPAPNVRNGSKTDTTSLARARAYLCQK